MAKLTVEEIDEGVKIFKKQKMNKVYDTVTNQTLKENAIKEEIEKAERSNDEATRLAKQTDLQEMKELHRKELNDLKK